MGHNVMFIVGDHLTGSHRRNDMVGISDFIAGLRTHDYREQSEPPLLVPGQGVGQYEQEFLRAELRRHGLPDSLLLRSEEPIPIGRNESHKRRPENVLLANLRQLDADLYHADLRVQDTHEMVLDHAMGEHLSGMLIMESARQMYMAVAERFFLSRQPENERRFVIHSWDVEFHRFLAPLDSEVRLRVDKADDSRSDRLLFRMVCDIVQAGSKAASATMDFSAMRADTLANVEDKQIDKTIEHLVNERLTTNHPATAGGSRFANLI